jgi:predicted DNA-binding protein YlxM (UPF0122 family)
MGRPLPYGSPTAQPYLEQLEKTNKVENQELFISTDCSGCPINTSCKSPCNQISDFIERDKKAEPSLYFSNLPDNVEPESSVLEPANFVVSGKDIPWDALPSKKCEIIRKHVYEQYIYVHIAELMNLNNQARVKYEFYSALNRLSEYAMVRKFLDEHGHELTDRQREIFNLVYRENLSYVKAAEKLGISKQSVQQTVSRILKRYNVKWKKYVRKHKAKVYYNATKMFRE